MGSGVFSKFKCTICVCIVGMGHKTITISDKAYTTLKKRKRGGSFTDVILREFAESNADRILAVVMGPKFPDKELEENVMRASEAHRKIFMMR